MNSLYEVHTHLYGCLRVEDIHWLGKRKIPRWEIYRQSYRKLYGKEPNLEILYKNQIFSNEKLSEIQKNILKSFYIFDSQKPSGFLHFQLSFDFIIALSHTDPEELQEIAIRVIGSQEEKYSEYRMMFSPLISENEFDEKVSSLVEGFQKAEKLFPHKEAKLIISLNREYPLYERQYEILKNIYKKNQNILIGIDFAGYEEDFPPSEKKSFIQKVKEEKIFCVLYHVGESFQTISPSSSIRWIEEVSSLKVDRIGHAVSLGLEEKMIKNKIYYEKYKERENHLLYLETLYEMGETWIPIDYVFEQKKILNSQVKEKIKIHYGKEELSLYFELREYIIEKLRKEKTVIESCPTSNMRIVGFTPLPFFIKNQLEVCLGADDPGIFEITLAKEFELVSNLVKNDKELEKIKENNRKYSCKNLKEYNKN